MHIYTSEEILEMEDLCEISESCEVKYIMTEGEIGWLDFVRGRYAIADYVLDNSEENDNGELVLSINSPDMSEALIDDDCAESGKAVCLSDDTALQRLFFWMFIPAE